MIRRYTKGEALKLAFRDSCLMTLPAIIIGTVFVYWVLHSGYVVVPARIASGFFYVPVGVGGYLLAGGTLVGYMQNRAKKTDEEIREQEREKARQLLSKYPDLAREQDA